MARMITLNAARDIADLTFMSGATEDTAHAVVYARLHNGTAHFFAYPTMSEAVVIAHNVKTGALASNYDTVFPAQIIW